MKSFIENQNWRYATKKFDTTKKVSQEDLEILIEAVRLSASSYGLQPYKLILVENKELREQLKPASWNQSQITEASHLLVFANYAEINAEIIDNHIKNTAEQRNIPVEALSGYGDFVKGKILSWTKESQSTWSAKQTYIALGNLLHAAAELKIDVTPMEGFEPEKYNEILGLNDKNLTVSLVAPIGYRHEEDAYQNAKKVRKQKENFLITI